MSLQANYEESIEFLKQWRGENGPWVLTSIHPFDKTQIDTTTFVDADRAYGWIKAHNKDRNIYFMVNEATKRLQVKASVSDVQTMTCLHVDVDPRPGEDFDSERKRTKRLLTTNKLLPSVVIDSGGGYQAFWLLMEPVPIDGNIEKAESYKLYNKQLEYDLGGDNCHNLDRIMRLPGTWNIPNQKKIDKGRQKTVASLVHFKPERIYPLNQFKKFQEIQSGTATFGPKTRIQGTLRRVALDEFPLSIAAKNVILQGIDPEKKERFGSRSEALFFVCCEMVRAEMKDEDMFSVITDKDYKISESVLEKGRAYEKYALRQIERAREKAIDPKLLEMNDKYACVSFNGKMRVITEEWDTLLERNVLSKMAFTDFRQKFMNQTVQEGKKQTPLGMWWLMHEKRRQYDKVVFAPNRETPNDYNLWRGFACAAQPGDKHLPFLDHIRHNMCNDDEYLYKYVCKWMANAVQNPDSPGHTAIVMRGEMGVGKGFVAKHFGRLFGRHFVHVANATHLTGQFNQHLRDCVVLFADEAFYAGDKKHANVLKALVTEETLVIEPKGVDSEIVGNCLHLLMASNEDWVVPTGTNERRFVILDFGAKQMQNTSYFSRIASSLRDGGYENLLYFLQNLKFNYDDIKKIPKTPGLVDQKIHSFDMTTDWWYYKLMEGKVLQSHAGWNEDIACRELIQDYEEYIRNYHQFGRKQSAAKLSHILRGFMPSLGRKQGSKPIEINREILNRPYYWQIPDLETCRQFFDKRFGGPFPWPEDVKEFDNRQEYDQF